MIPLNREYPSAPILAVSATLFHSDHSVLLILRAKPPAQNRWALPGGVVQLGESPEHAVKREISEECGLAVVPKALSRILSHVFHDTDGNIQYHYVVINYICDWRESEIKIGSDAADYQWVLPSRLHQLNLADGVENTVRMALETINTRFNKSVNRSK